MTPKEKVRLLFPKARARYSPGIGAYRGVWQIRADGVALGGYRPTAVDAWRDAARRYAHVGQSMTRQPKPP